MHIAIDGMLVRHGVSGVEHSIYGLAESLARWGEHDYSFFMPEASSLPSPGGSSFQTLRQTLPSESRMYRMYWENTRLLRLIEEEKCDLLHAPGYIGPYRAKIPFILTVHDLIALKFPGYCRLTNALNYRLQLAPSIRRAARVIVPSECTRMDLLNRFPEVEGRTEVIPVGIDDRFFKHQDKEHMRQVRERHQLPKHFLLFVGQLETKKNIPALIRSYTRLRAQHETDVKLVIAGNRGWGARAIDDAYEASLFQEDIQFTGFIPDTDLPALMCQAEAFVFPSLYEGFGMPPLEAMACGTPVITSDAGALPEVVDDAALTVDPRDDAALADAVEAVLTDRKLAADLVKKGRERARCFQWKGIAAATEEFYTHI